MTIRDAYLKAKTAEERCELEPIRLRGCLDFGQFWGFFFVPQSWPQDEVMFGGVYITVDKLSGNLSSFTPTMDFDLFDNAVKIPVEQFEPSPVSFEERMPTERLAYA